MTTLPLPADASADLGRQLKPLAKARWGTLRLPDTSLGLSRPLRLPVGVSLVMEPTTRLVALPGFKGEAMIETEPYPHTPGEPKSGWQPRRIIGGMLDGNEQPVIGLRTIHDREIDITDLTVRNCLRKGIEIGEEGDCEVNLRSVRVQCERGVYAEEDSIGIHYRKATDSLVSQATIIGYAVGVRAETSSCDFQQMHVWNYDLNVKLRTCFECAGWNDSYSQCYADSPMNGDQVGIGFHVLRPFQRFSDCRVYLNQWVTAGKVVGFKIEPHGTHGTYMGNHFAADPKRPFKACYAGTLQAATILGNSYTRGAQSGAVTQLPSRGGGTTKMPPLHVLDDDDQPTQWPTATPKPSRPRRAAREARAGR